MILSNFSRIEGAVDINLLQDGHIVGVGAGGAYSLYDSFVRSGIGKLTVFDFDEVEEVNVVRQGYSPDQIGKKKVDALGDHLKSINSGLRYEGIKENFLHMTEQELDAIFGHADLLLFLTDSFEAQAYGNKLALHYQVPSIWGGYYAKSRCAEIVFTIPAVTPACYRCAVSSRYEQQAQSGDEIKVSSNFNTIFHSQLLDSYLGMVAMAILHNQTRDFEYSNWFGDHWDRNLLQLKVHPDHSAEEGRLFQRVFEPTGGRCVNFNSIWQQIKEESPPEYDYCCPDCGGTADLTAYTPHATDRVEH